MKVDQIVPEDVVLGNKALFNENYPKAKLCYLKAIKEHPDYAIAYNNLAELYLDNKNLDDVDAKWLGKMLELNTISLKKLILSDNNISVKGMKSLGEALKSNTSLVKLDLYNQIDDNGIQYIIDGLKYNNTLIELTIWKNTISESVRKELYDIQRYKLHGTNGYKEMDEFYIWS